MKFLSPIDGANMLIEDANNRLVSDAEKTAWNSKLDASSYTANDVLNKVKSVDGPGSGLDADTLDGKEASSFAESAHRHNELPPFIAGTQATSTNVFTGSAPSIDALYDGLSIRYWLPYNGTSTSATLELTLSDSSTTGPINCYYRGTTRLTTHFTAGTIIWFTYRENVSISGSGSYTGWWASAAYADGNNYDRMYWGNTITAGAPIYDYKLLMQASDGRFHPLTLENGTGTTKTVSTQEFVINSPILYYASTTDLSIGVVTTSVYSEYPISNNLIYTANQSYWESQKNIYLKCTVLSNGNLRLDNTTYTSFMTQDLPTEEDGFVYVLLGYMYTYTNMRLFQYHPIYEFKDGAIREYTVVHSHAVDDDTYGYGDTTKAGHLRVGSGLSVSNGTVSHSDTSSQTSVNSDEGTVIQDVTLDTYGHVTGLGSTNLDNRYVRTSFMATSDSGGSYVDQYCKIGTVNITARYQQAKGYITFFGVDSNTGIKGMIFWCVRQNSAMGQAPKVELSLIFGEVVDPTWFVAVTTQNDASTTTVVLYTKVQTEWERIYFSPIHFIGDVDSLTWYETQPYIASLPAGTVSSCTWYSQINHSNRSALDNVSGTNTGDETVTTVGSLINGADEKTSPADADLVGLVDSAGSNILKKLSWGNIKTVLGSFFLKVSGGQTLTGILTAQSNTSYTTKQVRNITLSTEDPIDGVGGNGDIWFKYID